MLFHFPQFQALCAAEDMTHNLRNLYLNPELAGS